MSHNRDSVFNHTKHSDEKTMASKELTCTQVRESIWTKVTALYERTCTQVPTYLYKPVVHRWQCLTNFRTNQRRGFLKVTFAKTTFLPYLYTGSRIHVNKGDAFTNSPIIRWWRCMNIPVQRCFYELTHNQVMALYEHTCTKVMLLRTHP